ALSLGVPYANDIYLFLNKNRGIRSLQLKTHMQCVGGCLLYSLFLLELPSGCFCGRLALLPRLQHLVSPMGRSGCFSRGRRDSQAVAMHTSWLVPYLLV